MAWKQSPEYRKRYEYDRHRGLTRTVNITPVKEHLQSLLAAGLTGQGIAVCAGVSKSTINRTLDGTYDVMRVTTSRRILAVTREDVLNRPDPCGLVPAIGSVRRIQALLTMGWRHSDMHARYGIRTALVISRGGQWIEAAKHAAVKAMYDDLWDLAGPSTMTRKRSLAAGLVPPQGWDDDTIDDPRARPAHAAAVSDYNAVDLEDVVQLLQAGETIEQVARRVARTEESIVTAARKRGTPEQHARVLQATEAMNEIRRGLAS